MPTAIITGGAVRIGKALACHLADRGYKLALHHNASSPKDVIDHAQKKGVACKLFPCDLTDLAAAERLLPKIVEEFSDVDLLINSAANFIQENVEATSPQTLIDTMHLISLCTSVRNRSSRFFSQVKSISNS